MKTPLKPKRLFPGDTIGLIAPASPPPDPKAIDRAVEALERYGFRPKPGRHVRARNGYLAGSDRERAGDLMKMFEDHRVKGIVCLRGGYGCARILDRLDYALIRRNPKVFAGFSDITTLHNAFLTKTGMVTFHAPMWNGALADAKVPDFTRSSFLRTVTEAIAPGSIVAGYTGKTVAILRGGTSEGRLVGGNLSVLCASLGTPFAPSFKRKILFFEDIGEKPYRLDRLLTQLLNSGALAEVAGVAVGINRDCEETGTGNSGEYRQSSLDVLQDRLSSLRGPVVIGLPFGHVDMNATLPVNVRARLDGRLGDLVILESAVR